MIDSTTDNVSKTLSFLNQQARLALAIFDSPAAISYIVTWKPDVDVDAPFGGVVYGKPGVVPMETVLACVRQSMRYLEALSCETEKQTTRAAALQAAVIAKLEEHIRELEANQAGPGAEVAPPAADRDR
jgi:hypothetical protein